MSALFAWVLLGYAQYTLLSIVLLPQQNTYEKYMHIFLFEFFSFMTLASHIMTVFTDPGSIPTFLLPPEHFSRNNKKSNRNQIDLKNYHNDDDSMTQQEYIDQRNNNQAAPGESSSLAEVSIPIPENWMIPPAYKCGQCYSVKPDRAHHCSVCNRCIKKMDHHCPWVNNCVGERNQKYFVLFTFYVALLSSHALYLTANHLLVCLDSDWDRPKPSCPIMNHGRPSPGKLIMLVFLIFEALLFSLFSFIMCYMQLKAIWTDYTGIEHLKKESRDRVSGCENFRKVCGSNFLLWLSPFTSPPDYPDPQIDQLVARHQVVPPGKKTKRNDCNV